jgi:hypothetical protein
MRKPYPAKTATCKETTENKFKIYFIHLCNNSKD